MIVKCLHLTLSQLTRNCRLTCFTDTLPSRLYSWDMLGLINNDNGYRSIPAKTLAGEPANKNYSLVGCLMIHQVEKPRMQVINLAETQRIVPCPTRNYRLLIGQCTMHREMLVTTGPLATSDASRFVTPVNVTTSCREYLLIS